MDENFIIHKRWLLLVRKRNKIARSLLRIRKKIVKPKKGKGSFKRKSIC